MDKIPHLQTKRKKALVITTSYIFFLALIIIFTSQFLEDYISQIIKNIVLIIAIISGVLTITWNFKETEIELERRNSKENKSFFEDKIQLLLLILIIVFASFLILHNLGSYSFQVDEIFHALVAKNLNSLGFKLNENSPYFRGALVSVLAFLSKSLMPFTSREFSYRLPIALFGIVNVALVYFLSKNILKDKKISILVAGIYATDLLFIIFARYLRFYTISITVILSSLLLLTKNYSKRNLLIVTSIFTISAIILNEYFILLAGIIFLIYLKESREIFSKKTILAVLGIGVALGVFLYSTSKTSANFLSSILSVEWKTIYMQAHISWLVNTYPLIVVSLFMISTLMFFKYREKYLIFFILINILGIILIDLTKFNFTIRIFLFWLPLALIYSIKTIQYAKIPRILTIIFLLAIFLVNSYQAVLWTPNEYGDQFVQNKYIYEKQPLIIDTRSPSEFVENMLKNDNKTDFTVIDVALNDLYYYYYTNQNPDYLLRWKGTIKNDKSLIGSKTLYTLDDLKKQLVKEKNGDNKVIIITYATIEPIENDLYSLLFNKTPTEADPEIEKFIKSNGTKIFSSEDGYSAVYEIE